MEESKTTVSEAEEGTINNRQVEPPPEHDLDGSNGSDSSTVKSRVLAVMDNVLRLLLYHPCTMYAALRRLYQVYRNFRKRRKQDKEAETLLNPSEEIQCVSACDTRVSIPDYKHDLVEDVERGCYKEAIRAIKATHTLTPDTFVWPAVAEELYVVCENDMEHRLQIWIQALLGEDSSKLDDFVAILLGKCIAQGRVNCALRLVDAFPRASGQWLTEGQYKGLTPFHLAIIKRQRECIVKMIQRYPKGESNMESLTDVKAQALGPEFESVYAYSEVPLNLAVWVGDTDVLVDLVSHGADMTLADSEGNNCIHQTALLAMVDGDSAVEMCHAAVELIDSWALDTTRYPFLGGMSPSDRIKHGRRMVLFAENKNGYTPLKLAASVKCPGILERILGVDDVYRYEHFKRAAGTSFKADMLEIDPLLACNKDVPSALETLAFQYSGEKLTGLSLYLPVMNAMYEVKTKQVKPYMWVWATTHTIFMIVYSFVAYFTIFPGLLNPRSNVTAIQSDTNNDSERSEKNVISETPVELSVFDYILLVVSSLCFMYSLLALHSLLRLRKRNKYRWKWHKSAELLRVMQVSSFLMFGSMTMWYIIIKSALDTQHVIFLCYSLYFGWMGTFLFVRLFKSTALFVIMTDEIYDVDINRFLVIMWFTIFAFCIAAMCLISVDHVLMDLLDEPKLLMMNFFRLATGLSDVEVMWPNATHSVALYCLYIAFLLVVNVMMMNLLIAALSYTYNTFSNMGDLLCRKVQLRDFIVMEAILPVCLQQRLVTCYDLREILVYETDGCQRRRQLYLLDIETKDEIIT